MSGSHNAIDHIINWMNSFDPSHLQNEDDVETKFVLPLLQYLEYPEECRRGKYPIDDYQSEKNRAGRKREIDQIYFSVKDTKKQNQDTSLLIVEAKEPQEHNLDGAIKQAKYYGNHLTPIFLVVTNGHHLKALKRHPHRGEEIIFDISTDQLRNKLKATEVYNQLRFKQVKDLKEHGTDTLAHALYIEMMNLSKRYPDIQAHIAKGDYEPSTTQEGRRLIVQKPKVAITCELPIAFEEGGCSIEFSNLMLRGLTCHLSHAEILSNLLIGLKTSPDWESRPFLQKAEKGFFKANLGQTTVILSESETQELCNTIDEVFEVYKNIMIKTANNLETWDYQPVKIEDIKGFNILSVKQWLWELMQEFSHEFDYDEGFSDWHIFDRGNISIRVQRKYGPTQVLIWPKVESIFKNSDWIDLLYVDSITYLSLYRNRPQELLFKDIDPEGVWTATYTKEWIVHKFIRKVLSHFAELASFSQHPKKGKLEKVASKLFSSGKRSSKLNEEQLNAIIRQSVYVYHEKKDTPLLDISKPEELAEYLHRIQSYLLYYEAKNVPASLLRPYYAALTDLARSANSNTDELSYLQEKLGAVQLWQKRRHQDLSTYKNILKYLEQQVKRIHKVDFEDHTIAELLSRAFIDIIETKTTHFQQAQLNTAKDALLPLWEECRFHYHFIEPLNSFT